MRLEQVGSLLIPAKGLREEIGICNDGLQAELWLRGECGQDAVLRANATVRKGKEADVVVSGASDRGSKVGLWMERGCRAEALVSSGQVGPRYPDPCGVGLLASWAGRSQACRQDAGTVAARSGRPAANDSNDTRAVTGSGPLPEAKPRHCCFQGCPLLLTLHSHFRSLPCS